MNFFSHYTQMWVNRRSRKAYKSHRVVKWTHHYKQSYVRWLATIKSMNLPPIRGTDPVPTVVHYTFTYKPPS